ncbi:hypothetical protein HanRHA438_Chr06g0282761 [Helianthus annuus]|nr:hypothetical protein HanRHA438_Chr06g0282761 [Helianthus annuus]
MVGSTESNIHEGGDWVVDGPDETELAIRLGRDVLKVMWFSFKNLASLRHSLVSCPGIEQNWQNKFDLVLRFAELCE